MPCEKIESEEENSFDLQRNRSSSEKRKPSQFLRIEVENLEKKEKKENKLPAKNHIIDDVYDPHILLDPSYTLSSLTTNLNLIKLSALLELWFNFLSYNSYKINSMETISLGVKKDKF